jgi:hypothetical protein
VDAYLAVVDGCCSVPQVIHIVTNPLLLVVFLLLLVESLTKNSNMLIETQ